MAKAIVFVSTNKQQIEELYKEIKKEVPGVKLDQDLGNYSVIECGQKKFGDVLKSGMNIAEAKKYSDVFFLSKPDLDDGDNIMCPVITTTVKER